MTALSKRIEAEIEAGRCTDVPSVNDNLVILATRYGYVEKTPWGNKDYWPLEAADTKKRAVESQIAYRREELRMYKRIQSEVRQWQIVAEQGAKE